MRWHRFRKNISDEKLEYLKQQASLGDMDALEELETELEKQTNNDSYFGFLKIVDQIRRQHGKPPYIDTRIRRAEEAFGEANYQCFMRLSDLVHHLEYEIPQSSLMEIDDEDFGMADELNQLRNDIENTIEIRREAQEDSLRTLAGQPSLPSWIEYLKSVGLEPIEVGPLPDSSEVEASFAPHMYRPGAGERLERANNIRAEMDEKCCHLLGKVLLFGLANPNRIEEIGILDVEDTPMLFEQIERALRLHVLANEELLLARLGDPLNPEYVELLGENRLWRHIRED
jgi:hypothetical protein